jgi:hypothetical protein
MLNALGLIRSTKRNRREGEKIIVIMHAEVLEDYRPCFLKLVNSWANVTSC